MALVLQQLQQVTLRPATAAPAHPASSSRPAVRALQSSCRPRPAAMAAAAQQAVGVSDGAHAGIAVDQTLNPRVAGLKLSKTMALTDMARSMKEAGVDVSRSGTAVMFL